MSDSSHSIAHAVGNRTSVGEGWAIKDVAIEPRGLVMVHLHRDEDGANVEVLVTAPGTSVEALSSTPLGNVAYREYSGVSEQEVAELTRNFAAHLASGEFPLVALFPHLAIEASSDRKAGETRAKLTHIMAENRPLLPGSVSSEGALVLPETKPALFFDPPGLAEFVAPQLVIDGDDIGGFILRAIYLPPVARRESPDFQSYVFEFERGGDGSSTHVVVGTRGSFPQVFGHAGPIAIGIRHFGKGKQDVLGTEMAQLCSWMVALFEMKQGEGFELRIPSGANEVRALSMPAHKGPAVEIALLNKQLADLDRKIDAAEAAWLAAEEAIG